VYSALERVAALDATRAPSATVSVTSSGRMQTRTRARRRFGGDLQHLPADLDRGDPGLAAQHRPATSVSTPTKRANLRRDRA